MLAEMPELSVLILELAREHGRVTVAEAVRVSGASRNTVKDHLKALVERGPSLARGRPGSVVRSCLIRSRPPAAYSPAARSLRRAGPTYRAAEGEVRIMGSKSRLLQTLVANSGANAVPTQGLNWRRGRDSNPR
jgi:hypothetical protein